MGVIHIIRLHIYVYDVNPSERSYSRHNIVGVTNVGVTYI